MRFLVVEFIAVKLGDATDFLHDTSNMLGIVLGKADSDVICVTCICTVIVFDSLFNLVIHHVVDKVTELGTGGGTLWELISMCAKFRKKESRAFVPTDLSEIKLNGCSGD